MKYIQEPDYEKVIHTSLQRDFNVKAIPNKYCLFLVPVCMSFFLSSYALAKCQHRDGECFKILRSLYYTRESIMKL